MRTRVIMGSQYHEGMQVPYESTGRIHQKTRTRRALTDAARELLAQGVAPTVERAAKAASVSRTTAYRYFPNQWALVAAAFPHVDEQSLLGPNPTNDPLERLESVAEALTRRVLTHEAEMRAVLRLSLEGIRPPELPMHRGLRLNWVEDALQPLARQLKADELRRLAYGISATLGIEAFVWLTDIAQLPRKEAASVMRANASGLLKSAIAPPR
jgi:AcrR family transcriptional regulator